MNNDKRQEYLDLTRKIKLEIEWFMSKNDRNMLKVFTLKSIDINNPVFREYIQDLRYNFGHPLHISISVLKDIENTLDCMFTIYIEKSGKNQMNMHSVRYYLNGHYKILKDSVSRYE